jgi:hypothetical protein
MFFLQVIGAQGIGMWKSAQQRFRGVGGESTRRVDGVNEVSRKLLQNIGEIRDSPVFGPGGV